MEQNFNSMYIRRHKTHKLAFMSFLIMEVMRVLWAFYRSGVALFVKPTQHGFFSFPFFFCLESIL